MGLWNEITRKAPGARLVMVVGGSDTGKTTVVEALAGEMSREGDAAVVDLDMGQSHIGPPSVVSWGSVGGGFPGWGAVPVEGWYFTGALSPPGSMLPAIVGARKMVEEALGACPRAVVDTTGLVTDAGRVLKQYKVELLRPDAVVVLEREGELSDILDTIGSEGPVVVRPGIPSKVRRKSVEERAAHRTKRFRDFFRGAVVRSATPEVRLAYTRDRVTGRALEGRVASLRDPSGRDLALGVVECAGREILVRTPYEGEFETILVGSFYADFL